MNAFKYDGFLVLALQHEVRKVIQVSLSKKSLTDNFFYQVIFFVSTCRNLMLRPHLAHTAISCQKAGLTKINEAVPFAVLQYNAKQIEYLVEPYRELQSGNYGDD